MALDNCCFCQKIVEGKAEEEKKIISWNSFSIISLAREQM
jgi:hypothetical protein